MDLLAAGASLLGGALGGNSGQKAALKAQARLTNQMSNTYQEQMPALTAYLRGQMTNLYGDPAYQSAMRNAEGYAQTAMLPALNALGAYYKQRFGGGGSSYEAAGANQLASNMATHLAGLRYGQVQQARGLQNAAAAALGGLVAPQGGQALASYGNLAQAYGQQNAGMGDALGGLLQQWAMSQIQKPTNPVGPSGPVNIRR